MWLYLDKNTNGYRLELSQKACADWGLKKDSYYRAVKELQEKGYLQETTGGRFIFFEAGAEPEAEAGGADRQEAGAEPPPDAEKSKSRKPGVFVSFAASENLSADAKNLSQNQERNNINKT